MLPSLCVVMLLGALATSVAPASANQRAMHILIVSSDGTHTERAIKQDVAAVPGVVGVDIFDASSQTPTLGLMDNYDAVVVYSNTDFADPATLGDNLAAYADRGAQVVEFGFDWDSRAQRRPAGRWATSGYSPYTVGGTTAATAAGLAQRVPSAPFLFRIGALTSNASMDPALASGSIEVAKWSDGRSAMAFKGHVLGVNACVADGCGTPDPGFARVIVNTALTGVAGQLLTPNQGCAADTFVQTSVSDGNPYFVQRGGVVTSWYSQAAAGGPISGLELKVGRQDTPEDPFTIIGTSAAGAQQLNQINGPYPTRITVNGSDVIGLFTDGTGLCAKGTAQTADSFGFARGDIPAGTTAAFMGSNGVRFPVEAIVEPDLDHDGFGDLTQDQCPGMPGPQQGCPVASTPPSASSPPAVAPAGTLTAAVISGARETNRRWREPRRSKLVHVSRRALPVGTTFSFSLDEPAAVRLDFIRRGSRGRVSGTLRIRGHAGTNAVHFLGYLTRRKRLNAGSYVVRITAATPGAPPSSQTLSFTIVR